MELVWLDHEDERRFWSLMRAYEDTANSLKHDPRASFGPLSALRGPIVGYRLWSLKRQAARLAERRVPAPSSAGMKPSSATAEFCRTLS